jgi:hypothetical protein
MVFPTVFLCLPPFSTGFLAQASALRLVLLGELKPLRHEPRWISRLENMGIEASNTRIS